MRPNGALHVTKHLCIRPADRPIPNHYFCSLFKGTVLLSESDVQEASRRMETISCSQDMSVASEQKSSLGRPLKDICSKPFAGEGPVIFGFSQPAVQGFALVAGISTRGG